MRINARYCKLGGLLLLALTIINAARWQSAAVKKAAGNDAKQLVRAQVVDQVEPLCRALFPDQDVLRFQAMRTPQYHKGSLRENLWSVDCLDTNANVLAQVIWNVDTKRALQFDRTPFYASLREKHSLQRPVEPVNEKQAVAIAREWASRLRPVSGKALQQSGYRTQPTSTGWKVRLQLPDGAVRIWINAESGELQSAIVQDAPVPDSPDANIRP